MAIDFTSIRQQAKALHDELISVRRTLHQNPELGFQEIETAKLIKGKLDEMGIPYRSEIARTGIIATIEGKAPGKTIAIRADMDALPMEEDTDFEFKSKNPGVMHACGHDTHVSCLLAAAKILKATEFNGKVLLIFQPAEEGSIEYDPSGKIAGGAKPMLMEGALEGEKLDAVLALHIVAGENPEDQLGCIGVKDGPFSGSADEFYITVKGKGGHASAPHDAIDPVYIASQIAVNIQGWLSRRVDPMEPVVFTVGKIQGGFRQNIISEHAKMDCTLRTLNEELRSKIKTELPETIRHIAQAYGGDVEIEIRTGYPVGKNDEIVNQHIRKAFQSMYSKDNLIEVQAQLGAEDFYEFGLKNTIPISMFWLGAGNKEKGYTVSNHSNYFSIDEDALPIGTATLAGTALSFLDE